MGAWHDAAQARHGWVDEAPAADAVREVWEEVSALSHERLRVIDASPAVYDGDVGDLLCALRESYAIVDHLTIDHRARGCNESCDWWPRVQAIKGRNK